MLIDRRRYERKKDLRTAKHFYLEKFHRESNAVDFVQLEIDVIDTHLKLSMQLQCFQLPPNERCKKRKHQPEKPSQTKPNEWRDGSVSEMKERNKVIMMECN